MKVAIMRLRSWLWLTWSNSLFVEYGASIASDFDSGDQCFGEQSLYYFFEVNGLRLFKTHTPSQAFPVRKRVRSLSKCEK
jgi:hypothetical protein